MRIHSSIISLILFVMFLMYSLLSCDAPAIAYREGLQTEPNDEITFEEVKTGGLKECEKFLKKYPESKEAEQVEIWKAVLAGEEYNERELTALTVPVAKALAQSDEDWLYLRDLKSITPAEASELPMFKGDTIYLDGLTDLSADVSKALSKWKRTG